MIEILLFITPGIKLDRIYNFRKLTVHPEIDYSLP